MIRTAGILSSAVLNIFKNTKDETKSIFIASGDASFICVFKWMDGFCSYPLHEMLIHNHFSAKFNRSWCAVILNLSIITVFQNVSIVLCCLYIFESLLLDVSFFFLVLPRFYNYLLSSLLLCCINFILIKMK